MSEKIAAEIWSELKGLINPVDRVEAAETMVQILMDNDSAANDIRAAFKGDSDIRSALAAYLVEEPAEEEEEDNEQDEQEDDDNWEN